MANYYELLGLPPHATAIEIRAAYTRDLLGLERSIHPNAARFRAALNEAVDTLLDPEKRSAYDAQLHAKKVKPPKPAKAPKAAKPPKAEKPPKAAEPPKAPKVKAPVAATIAVTPKLAKTVKKERTTALPADPSRQASAYARNGGLACALGGLISAFAYVFSNGNWLLAWAPLLGGVVGLAWWGGRYLRMPKVAWQPDHVLFLGGMILVGVVSAGWVGVTPTTP